MPQPDSWNLTTADFRAERVQLRGLDPSAGLRVSSPGNDTAQRTVGFDKFLSLTRLPAPKPQQAKFVAVLTGGDRLAGEPIATAGESVEWSNRALGNTKLSMRRIVAIVRAGAELDPGSDASQDGAKRDHDTVLLVNGDAVNGVISEVSAAGAAIQPAGAEEVTRVPADSILAILFASVGGRSSPANANASARSFRVTLADSTVVTVSSPSIQGTNLRLNPSSEPPAQLVPLDQVASIEQLNGPVVWLSNLVPSESVQVPFLDLTFPARMDAGVTGNPVRFGDQTFAHGIGVHAYSRLSFPIDGRAMQALRTQYAIEGDDAPYANVTVRIKLDGKVIHERTNFAAGELSPVVTLETGGARTLTLEVDYGKNADVQDRFLWIEPALLREKPAPPPPAPATIPSTTAPTTRP